VATLVQSLGSDAGRAVVDVVEPSEVEVTVLLDELEVDVDVVDVVLVDVEVELVVLVEVVVGGRKPRTTIT
jgi:hypothetical protein